MNTFALATKEAINRYRTSPLCTQFCGAKPFGSRHWEYPWAIEQSGILSRSNLRILDVAPDFTFPYASFLEANHKVTFIDLEKRQWSDAVTWGAEVSELAIRSDYRLMDVRNMAFPAETFDAIFCISVLEHIVCPTQDPNHPELARIFDPLGARPALTEIRRCLKTGGRFLLTVDIYQGLKWKSLFDTWKIHEDLVACGFRLPAQLYTFDELLADQEVFLSDFHGPYFTLGFALTK